MTRRFINTYFISENQTGKTSTIYRVTIEVRIKHVSKNQLIIVKSQTWRCVPCGRGGFRSIERKDHAAAHHVKTISSRSQCKTCKAQFTYASAAAAHFGIRHFVRE